MARPEQLAPDGNWSTWLILAGRGFGKTRTGAEWVRENVCGKTPLAAGRYKRLALVAETASDTRDVLTGDGLAPGEGSGIMQVHPKDFRPIYEPSKRRLTWPNGATAHLFNGTEPDQLRGPQFDAAWLDELAKYKYGAETWAMLSFGLRLGTNPRALVTTTPKPIRLLKQIIADPGTVVTRGSTMDNAANLAPSFLSGILRRYEGTRLGRQELNAEILEDVVGALWKLSDIESTRIKPEDLPTMRRIVVAIDPAVTSGEDSDETGIVVVGVGADGRGYVLEDRSGKYSPDEFARQAIIAYYKWKADRVIAEVNNGGEMCEAVLRTIDANVAYKAVHASRGKIARAEPVAAIYEQRRVSHVGMFSALEDQMCAFTTDMSRKNGSPDRCDALVWGISELMVEHDSFHHAIAVMTKLYGDGSQQPTGDAMIDGGVWAPKKDDGQKVKLRVPTGISTAFGAHTGRRYLADTDGIVEMSIEDADAVKSWERVSIDA